MIPFPSYCCFGCFLRSHLLTHAHTHLWTIFTSHTHEDDAFVVFVLFGFRVIHIPFSMVPIAIHAKMQCISHLCCGCYWCCCFMCFFFFLFWRERKSERSFSISPFSTVRILTNPMFGMMRCASYIYIHSIDGMQPNEKQNFNYSHLKSDGTFFLCTTK